MMHFGSVPTKLVLDLASFINAGSILAHFSALSSAGDEIVDLSLHVMNQSSSFFQVVGNEELEVLCSSSGESSRPARLIVVEIEHFLDLRYRSELTQYLGLSCVHFVGTHCRIPPDCLRSNQHWLISTRCSVLPEKALKGALKFDSNVMTIEEDDSLTIVEWYQIPNGERRRQPIAKWNIEIQKLVCCKKNENSMCSAMLHVV